MVNNYTSEDILLLKKMIDDSGLRGPFFTWKSDEDNSSLDFIEENYKDPDTPLMTVNTISNDKKFSVDVYEEPEYYLKYIVSTSMCIALSNAAGYEIFPKFKDCVDWRDYLDGYDFVFHVKKEDIPMYINRKGLNILVKWRLKIGK